MKNYKNQSGFTLIELLVAITVFIVFVTFAIAAYIFLVKAHYNANEKRKMYAEAQQVMEAIVSNAKLYTIDYDCYTMLGIDSCGALDATDEVEVLALKDHAGNKKVRFHSDSDGKVYVRYWEGSDWGTEEELAGEHVNFDYLQFKINPKKDPLSEKVVEADLTYDDHETQFQPQVTIYLQLSHAAIYDMPPLVLQTTVTSRVYNKPIIQ